jgi:hypothetical protein
MDSSGLSKTARLDGVPPKREARGRERKSGERHGHGVILFCVVLVIISLCGCHKSEPASGPGPSQNKATPAPRTDFEQKLQYVRDGQFTHIYVFARKDGGAFDKEDVAYLTENSPTGEKTNMRVKTDDGRRVVVGTNFEFTQENFDALSKRFQIEDYTGR